MMRGNFGRPGAGICPVRGHSNVQGDRTVGIDEKPRPELLAQIEKVFGFAPPRRHGRSVVDTLQAIIDGRVGRVHRSGRKFRRGGPRHRGREGGDAAAEADRGINTKLNRTHIVHGEEALILPCFARSDIDIQATGRQSITVEDSMSMVHASGGLVTPPSSNLKSEVAIVCGMARATLPGSGIDWDAFEADYNLIRDKIEAVFPKLFAGFNARIRKPGGFHLCKGPQNREWNTPNGRANFLFCAGVAEDPEVQDPAALQLATIRSHEQYNTTIYTLDDRYRGVFGGRMVVFMNKDDMADRHIQPDSLVELESVTGGGDVRRTASGFKVRPYDIPRGSIAAYYPETNGLLPLSHHDKKSKTPSAKSIPVVVRAMASQGAA